MLKLALKIDHSGNVALDGISHEEARGNNTTLSNVWNSIRLQRRKDPILHGIWASPILKTANLL